MNPWGGASASNKLFCQQQPPISEVLEILCSLQQGTTLRTVCERFAGTPGPTTDIRRLVIFAQMHGLIKCLKRYVNLKLTYLHMYTTRAPQNTLFYIKTPMRRMLKLNALHSHTLLISLSCLLLFFTVILVYAYTHTHTHEHTQDHTMWRFLGET